MEVITVRAEVLATEAESASSWEYFAFIFYHYFSGPYLRSARPMIVGNRTPRVLRLFSSFLFPCRAASKRLFRERFSRTLAMASLSVYLPVAI